jgi:3-isopropylmalate/(R)-2-methylmalate dehydratase large subunit
MTAARTLFQKIWDKHFVLQAQDSPVVLYIDLQLVHEVTSPQAFADLRARGLKVRRPDRTVATIDHSVPTRLPSNGEPGARMVMADAECQSQVRQLQENCKEFGVPLFDLESSYQGIVHVIGPELGLTQPGMTIVCGDSHTATHGAVGALAFGIGTSEVEHVLATQCLLQEKPKACEVRIEGKLPRGLTAKDMILAVIAQIGVGGGKGCVVEYTGSAVRALSMEERMTVCNMSIEAGARAGLVAPDQVTFDYLKGRKYAPSGLAWERALEDWRSLPSDEGAVYDRVVTLDVSNLAPMITYGTNPGMAVPVTGNVPEMNGNVDPAQQEVFEKALRYMGFHPGEKLAGHAVDVVFIGSCTNGRLVDLQQAASLLKGRKVAPGVRVLVVPGSQQVKAQAVAEGLDRIFIDAGAEWREPGCSMCIGMNGDQLEPGQYAVSTSNRNFEGRQGKGGRTLLASPLTAVAAAITGKITDPRLLMN